MSAAVSCAGAAVDQAGQEPIVDKLNAQMKPAIAQTQALQGDARLQQLLKLAKKQKLPLNRCAGCRQVEAVQ